MNYQLKISTVLFGGLVTLLSIYSNASGYAAQNLVDKGHPFSEIIQDGAKGAENEEETNIEEGGDVEELIDGFLVRNYEYSLGEISEAEFQVFRRCLAVSTEITDSGVLRTSQCGQARVQISVISEEDYVTVWIKVNSGNLEASQEIHDLLLTNLER